MASSGLIARATDIPDQSGRTFVVTGANSGLGLATARALAGARARVVLAVRDPARGEAALSGLGGPAAAGSEVRRLDLASLDSVRTFAGELDEPVDVLILNAGVMAPPLGRTADGFETQIGVNHLGHFALAARLLPRVRDRIVAVSSLAHRLGGLDVDDLLWERRRYRRWPAYGASKLANLLFTLELQRRLTEAGSAVTATAAHPGYAHTNLQFHGGHPLRDAAGHVGNLLFAQSAAAGALPTLSAAVGDVPAGAFVGPSGPGESRGTPAFVGRSRAARDPELASQLWEVSERLTGVSAEV